MSDIKQAHVSRVMRSKERRDQETGDCDSSSTILKFSGVVPGGTSFLADGGSAAASPTPPRYPLPNRFNARAMTCNLLDGFTPPVGGTLSCQLVKNGSVVPGFVLMYKPGQTGVQILKDKHVPFRAGDTLGLVIIVTGVPAGKPVGMASALVSGGPLAFVAPLRVP
jgi:hypothetical protein